MDAEVLPYHWDDRAKLHADYRELRAIYERLLQDLVCQLNRIHGVDHTLRYWRILIGPWLGYFVQMLFDRWASIHQAIRDYELSGTIVLVGQEEALVPNDMGDFNRLYVRDDWNHYVYAFILQRFTTVPCTKRGRRDEGLRNAPAANWKRQLKRSLGKWYVTLASFLVRDRDVFFLATYLLSRDEMVLQGRLGQMPQFWRPTPPVVVPVDNDQRQWSVNGESLSEFEACARALIPRQIPSLYLEGYALLVEQIEALPWPKQPRLIWTSNSHNADDVFKAWAAARVEGGARLVIGQHGGHYGMGSWSFVEEHEIAISDCYLSWGWSELDKPKIKPVGQLKAKQPLGVRHEDQALALLVTTTVPRQSYHLYSLMVSRQWLDYFDDQCAFVEHLPAHIREALIVRLYSQDYGWDQVHRWHDRFPCLRLDEGRSKIDDLIRQSRLYISTYNATTYLESFSMNVPTVIFWNPNHGELRDSAIPYFEDLKRVGVFHETPESAARHVAAVWDDVGEWWSSRDVREVLDRFMARYCDLPDDLLGRVESVLCEVIAGGKA
jgi:putative transferase (TIGR04331 family)